MILLVARLEVLIGGPLKSIWEEAHNKLGLVMSRPRATLQGTFSIRPITLLCITSGYTAHTYGANGHRLRECRAREGRFGQFRRTPSRQRPQLSLAASHCH